MSIKGNNIKPKGRKKYGGYNKEISRPKIEKYTIVNYLIF